VTAPRRTARIPEGQRKRRRATVSLDAAVLSHLDAVCEREALDRSAVVELALREYLHLQGRP
jgi:metal-responsive CopG/Arc/MetJ family transcriptional regulator